MADESAWQACFNAFDVQRTGQLSQTDYLHCLRACGQRPNQKEAEEMLSAVGSDVSLPEFLDQMQKGPVGPTEQELLRALQVFDVTETGRLKQKDLYNMLITLGDVLTPEEAAKLFEHVGPADQQGQIEIKTLMTKFTQPIPTKYATIEGMAAELGIKL